MKLTIEAQKPYNFDLSCNVFSDGDPQIRKYEEGKFWQVLDLNSKLIYISVKSSGTVEDPELVLELKSNEDISDEDKEYVLKIILKMFNLDFNLKFFYNDVKNDKIMSKLTKTLYGLKTPTTQTVFESLVDSIVEQQISLKAAHSIERKIIKKFGSSLNIGSNIYYAYPTPEQLNNALFNELRKCGLSFRKVEYIKDISKQIINGSLDLEKFKEYENIDEIIDELCEIRGIGKWTAELIVIRGLNGLNSFPADDIGIRRVISHYYCNDEKISAKDARKIALKWGKWKGLAAFYLIIAEMRDIKI
ncbi:MAG TPA: DNA-3-methyladenine glycosylase [Methanobacterium sp.]|nr:DNA-3-methyladenine glycosylase [Methanobacterium sp.]